MNTDAATLALGEELEALKAKAEQPFELESPPWLS